MDDNDDLDLRSTIESAIDGDADDSAATSTPPEPVASQTPPDLPTPTPGQAPEGQVRDSLGRFVPKAKAPEAAGAPEVPGAGQRPTGAATGAPVAAQAPAQGIPPPASWSPMARETWSQVPAAAQQEIARRENEVARTLNDTAQARDVAGRFISMIQPHMATIQAEGVDPFTAVGNLMQATTLLRMGTPGEKANLIASLVKNYGIDIQMLDSALVGEQTPQGNGAVNPQYVQQAVQQALMPLMQAAQARQQQVAMQADANARNDLGAFASDPKNEFLDDLRNIMADLMEVANRQGYELSLRDAYDRAAQLHPEVSKVILARQQGANARQLTQAAQRAKGAAVSVRGSAPSGNPNTPEPSSIRESIEAAIDAHSRY